MNTKSNRTYLLLAVALAILQWVIFKFFYPYPDFFSDSYSYIFGAYEKIDINIWPIGYSKFLLYFHYITHSDTALVSFQYFFYILSALYFFFTIINIFNLKRNSEIILFIFLFANPLLLYLCNYVNSDPVFVALSLLWFTELIWIIYRPRAYQILTQSILVFLAFTVRNNAYYYPVIAALAFLISNQAIWRKIGGTLACLVLILPFILHSESEAYKLTGTRQFSLFTGWQLANNAFYMYDKIKVDSTKLPTPETRQVDSIARQFFKKIKNDDAYRGYLSSYVGNFFIRQPEAPLKKYLAMHDDDQSELGDVIAWGKASSVFASYGSYLIETHPLDYAKYFMILNTQHYFFPPLEKLEIYNLGMDEVEPLAKVWFNYPTVNVTSSSKTAQGQILIVFTFIFAFIHIYFIGYIVWITVEKNWNMMTPFFKKYLILTSVFLTLNFGFCVFATMIVLRYEVFPMVVIGTMLLMLIDATSRNIKNKAIKGNS